MTEGQHPHPRRLDLDQAEHRRLGPEGKRLAGVLDRHRWTTSCQMAASVRVYIARWCESGFKCPAPYLPGCDGLGPAPGLGLAHGRARGREALRLRRANTPRSPSLSTRGATTGSGGRFSLRGHSSAPTKRYASRSGQSVQILACSEPATAGTDTLSGGRGVRFSPGETTVAACLQGFRPRALSARLRRTCRKASPDVAVRRVVPRMYPATYPRVARPDDTKFHFAGVSCKTSDGLEPSTPSLP